jgi:hypothetical protein
MYGVLGCIAGWSAYEVPEIILLHVVPDHHGMKITLYNIIVLH